MRIVKAKSDITVAVERGRNAIALRRGVEYVMHDVEVASGEKAGALTAGRNLPSKPARWSPADSPALQGRMVVPFIGGLGDAVSMLPILAAIRKSHPRLTIEIATTPGPAAVFQLAGSIDRIVDYPLPARTWNLYDRFISMEVVHETAQQPGRPLPEVFAHALGMPGVRHELNMKSIESDFAIEAPSPRVAVAVGEFGSLRSAPTVLLQRVIDALLAEGGSVALLGDLDDRIQFRAAAGMTDLRSRTDSIAALACALKSMDVLIAHDSFILHLAGALGVPTVGVFTATSIRHAEPYSSVEAFQSELPCAPCHAARGGCPLGQSSCIAWNDDSVNAQRIVATTRSILNRAVVSAR